MIHPATARLPLDQTEVFFGQASPAEARIYVRLPATGLPGGAKLTGVVRGPRTTRGSTLQASIPLIDRGGGLARLAEAIIPDPCFWSPDQPFLYDVSVELQVHGAAWSESKYTLGIRPLGVTGAKLCWEGKPWTLRGIERPVAECDLEIWRSGGWTLVQTVPDEASCAAASKLGVPLVARLDGAGVDVDAELRRLSRWPAVIVALLPAASEPTYKPANMLLAVRPENDGPLPKWAQVTIARGATTPHAACKPWLATGLVVGDTVPELNATAEALLTPAASPSKPAGCLLLAE